MFLSISQSACHILFINACQDYRIFLQMQELRPVFIRETERCNGKFSASSSADQPKPKRLLHCCPYKTEPEQTVEAIDVSGPVKPSKGVSLPVSKGRQLF